MIRRDGPGDAGAFIRRVLEPMAVRIGVSYDESFVTPPQSDAALAMDALRCGQQLLMPFTYSDGWPVSASGTGGGKKLARKAARQMLASLPTDDGRDAVSWMAQGYGRSLATLWRRAAGDGDHNNEADTLHANADRSDELADLVHREWPVSDSQSAIAPILSAEQNRFFDPFNSDAKIDLHAYAVRSRAMAEAVAIAMRPRYLDFEPVIIGPVLGLNLELYAGTLADWDLVSAYWGNLFQPQPQA